MNSSFQRPEDSFNLGRSTGQPNMASLKLDQMNNTLNGNSGAGYDPTETFKKFQPRSEKKRVKKGLLDEIADFIYTPRRFFCPKHKDTEIEYCCKINEAFYCKLCLPLHHGHDDLVLAETCRQIQEDVIKLKHAYVSKKKQTLQKLDKHQERVEAIFKVYYDTLDELRSQYLGQEYHLRGTMDRYEDQIQTLMRDIKRYNYIEFYHEQYNLQQTIRDIRENLKTFNVYMPKY